MMPDDDSGSARPKEKELKIRRLSSLAGTPILAALVILMALPACAQKPATAQKATAAQKAASTTKPAESPDTVVIKAAGVKITKAEFDAAVQSLPDEYKAYASGPGKRAFAEDFLRMRLLAAKARENKLDQTSDVKVQLALMTANTLANAELERMKSAVTIPDAELKKMYDSKKNEYEQVSARHILIAFKGSPAVPPGKKALTDAEAKAKAEAIRAKLVAGADFAETAKMESDDRGSAARGGDLGTFTRGQMLPEFEKVAFETKVGEISPVIRTKFGYHILKVEKHNVIPFEEVKGQLEQKARDAKVRDELDAMSKAAGAEFDPGYFGPEKPAPEGAKTPMPEGAKPPQPEGH